MIRVLLVHDACLVRSALAEWLRREPDLGVFDTPWHTASGRLRAVRPDVCAADLDCSDAYGIPPLGELSLREPDRSPPRLLVMASANRPGLLKRAVEAGALGYVDKEGRHRSDSRAGSGGSPKGNVSSTTRWASASSRPPRCR